MRLFIYIYILYRLVGINMILVRICSEDVKSMIMLCTALGIDTQISSSYRSWNASVCHHCIRKRISQFDDSMIIGHMNHMIYQVCSDEYTYLDSNMILSIAVRMREDIHTLQLPLWVPFSL